MKGILSAILIFVSCVAFAKSTHEENLKQLKNSTTQEGKVEAYFNTITTVTVKEPDTALKYIEAFEQFIAESKYKLSPEKKSKLLFFKGVAQYGKGQYNRASSLITESIKLIKEDSLEGRRYFYLGLCNKQIGNYSQATDNFIKAVKKFEIENDKYAIVSVYINLGNVFRQVKNYPQALDYFNLALELASVSGNQKLNRNIYNNMGNVFLDMQDYETALTQFQASYDEAVKTKNQKGQLYTLINIADAKQELGRNSEAINHLAKALRIADTLNNASLKGKVFWELGNFFVELKNVPKAKLYLGKALQIADTLDNNPDLLKIYESYKNLYKSVGNYKKSIEFYEKYEAIKDSVNSRENTLKVTQLYSEFEFDKKEQQLELMARQREIEKQRLDLQQIEIDAQKIKGERDSLFIYLLIGVGILLLVSAAGFGFLSSLKHKKNTELEEINNRLAESQNEVQSQNKELEAMNTDLERINHEILNKNIEVESQKEELKAQRDLLNNTNEQLKARNKDVTDSIHYAQKIQQAMLNSSFQIDDSGWEHFTFYKPRNIVSGDFFWSHKIENTLFVAIGDCTGHGVPGAFMSCLGISLLNEIVFSRNVREPHSILEELRASVIQLIATDKNAELQIGDGMDIAIIAINLDTLNMKFSGAMNGVSIVQNGELIELTGDKSPIGQHIIPNHKFTIQEFQLQKDDHLYMFTDGYKDQFGGPRGKKLGKRRLNEELHRVSEFNMPVQYTEVITIYKNWRKFEEQIDDVCLFGLKVG